MKTQILCIRLYAQDLCLRAFHSSIVRDLQVRCLLLAFSTCPASFVFGVHNSWLSGAAELLRDPGKMSRPVYLPPLS